MRRLLVLLVLLAPAIATAQAIGIEGGVRGPAVIVVRTEEELLAAIASEPLDYFAYFELARLYASTKRVAEADRLLRELLKRHPNSGVVFHQLVILHATDLDKALVIAEDWARAATVDVVPLVTIANLRVALAQRVILLRGILAEALGHVDRGLLTIDQAEQIRPDDFAVMTARWMLLRAKLELANDAKERATLLADIEALGRRRIELAQRMAPPQAVASKTYPVRAIRTGGSVRPPRKIRDFRPMLPPEAVHLKTPGNVIVEIVIDTEGRVAEARVLRSVLLLDDLALEAARQWEFAPTEINGTRIPVIMTATVTFTRPPQ